MFIVGASIVTWPGLGVTAVLAVLAAKELVSGVIAYLAIRADLEQPATRRGAATGSGLLKIGMRLAIAGIAVALLMRIPLAFLGNSGTTREVALFSAAQRFGDAIYILADELGVRAASGSPISRSRPASAPGGCCTGCSRARGRQPCSRPSPFRSRTRHAAIFGSDFESGGDLLRIMLVGIPGYAALGVCWYAVVAFDGETRLVASLCWDWRSAWCSRPC